MDKFDVVCYLDIFHYLVTAVRCSLCAMIPQSFVPLPVCPNNGKPVPAIARDRKNVVRLGRQRNDTTN